MRSRRKLMPSNMFTTRLRGAIQPTYYYTQPTYGYRDSGRVLSITSPPMLPSTISTLMLLSTTSLPCQFQASSLLQPRRMGGRSFRLPTRHRWPDAAPAQPAQAAPAAGYGGSDPYGFLSWLNATRASYGLGAVGYDQNLSNWAAQNNNAQWPGTGPLRDGAGPPAEFGRWEPDSPGRCGWPRPLTAQPCLIPPLAGSGSPPQARTGRSTPTERRRPSC